MVFSGGMRGSQETGGSPEGNWGGKNSGDTVLALRGTKGGKLVDCISEKETLSQS